MLSNFKRIPLKRCLHTQIPRQSRVFSSRLSLTVGASLAVGSYLTWRLTTRDQRIALDSATKLEAPIKTVSIDSSSSETVTPKPALKRTKKLEDKPTTTTTEPSDADAETKTEGISEGEESKTEGEGGSSAGGGGGGGAYDPVTGEINWDCPCLGGMAYGPCGQEFREAFSCFIYSEEEPKGINCVDKFRAMQTCFREHPEHYADEIMDDDDDEAPSTPKPEASDSEGSPESPEPTLGAPAPVPASESSSNPSGSQS
ncbi:Oxidoreductase [Marasmius tenuissimus]|uniref:Mitochondrial intermembrane space import and assembly protein 40 n=1 Tax=Marasmius tenuissimus TaxID=585030 RepID=A0ABR3A4J3_9AGAR